jgi:hypothetical protein
MRKMIGMFVGSATLAGVVGVTNAFGLVTQPAGLTATTSSPRDSWTAICQPETQPGTTGVTLYQPPSIQGPDDSLASSCTYVSSNGAHNGQTWNSITPNTFTITVNDGHRVVEVEHHGDLANAGDQVVDQGSFTAPRGSVVTVSLLNGCPQPGACGSFGTVSAGAPDAPGSSGGGGGGGGGSGRGTISLAAFGTVHDGAVQLTISCAGGAACTGKLEVDATGANATKHRHKKPKPVVVATGSYSVPAGTTLTLRLALAKNGKALLKKRHGTLATTLKVTPTGGTTTTHALKLVQKKGKGKNG